MKKHKGGKFSWILINGETQITAGRMENFLKINKRVYPSIWDLRVCLFKHFSPVANFGYQCVLTLNYLINEGSRLLFFQGFFPSTHETPPPRLLNSCEIPPISMILLLIFTHFATVPLYSPSSKFIDFITFSPLPRLLPPPWLLDRWD